MKKFAKKFLTLALAAAVLFTSAPVTANAAPSVGSKYIVSRSSKTGDSYFSLYIGNLTKKQRVKNVKVANKSFMEHRYTSHYTNQYSYTTTYADPNQQDNNYNNTDYYAYIGLVAHKNGTSKVSFTIDGKKYEPEVEVKAYVNPCKTLTLTGVNGGKNMASKFNAANSISVKAPTKNAPGAKVTVSAKAGWKITQVSFDNYTDHTSLSRGYSVYWDEATKKYKGGVTNATLPVGDLAKGSRGYLRVTYWNVKDHSYAYEYVNIQ